MKKLLVLCGAVVFMCVSWTAFAQTPAPASTPPAPAPAPTAAPPASVPRAEPESNTRELAELVMAVKLTKELGLNDEQTILLVRKLAEFRDQTGELRKERQQATKELRNAIHAKEPESQIEAKLNALIAIDDKTAAFRKDKFAKLGEGLSPNKRAILYVFVNDFENEMKQLIQKVKERREQLMGEPGGRPVNPQSGPQGGMARERILERMQDRAEKESGDQPGQARERRREGGRQAPPEN